MASAIIFSQENVSNENVGSFKESMRLTINFGLLWKNKAKLDLCASMAGRGQCFNHVAAAMYRIEAAVRSEMTNLSCSSTASQWLPNHKDI